MYKVGDSVVLPGSFVKRMVEAVRLSPEGETEYQLSYDPNWYTQEQLEAAAQRAATMDEWARKLNPSRGRIVRHRLGRQGYGGR